MVERHTRASDRGNAPVLVREKGKPFTASPSNVGETTRAQAPKGSSLTARHQDRRVKPALRRTTSSLRKHQHLAAPSALAPPSADRGLNGPTHRRRGVTPPSQVTVPNPAATPLFECFYLKANLNSRTRLWLQLTPARDFPLLAHHHSCTRGLDG